MLRLLLRLRRRYQTRSRGQSLVEFALILPIFLLFFGTILDLGRIAAAQVTVSNVAREGALQASRTPTDFDSTSPCPAGAKSNLVICRTMLEAQDTSIGIAPSDIALSCDPACVPGLGNRVTVRVTGHFQLLTPFLTPFFGGKQSIVFSVASTHQIETLPPRPSPGILTSPPPSAAPSAAPTATVAPSGLCILPSAGFNWSLNPGNRKAPVMLTVTDTSTSAACHISTWFWKFDEIRDGVEIPGGTWPGQNPAPRRYDNPGTYSISLTVSNSAGSSTKAGVIFELRP